MAVKSLWKRKFVKVLDSLKTNVLDFIFQNNPEQKQAQLSDAAASFRVCI